MKLDLQKAAGWLVASAIVAHAPQVRSSDDRVLHADAKGSAAERSIQDATANFKDCHDWAGILKEEKPKQVRTFELCPVKGAVAGYAPAASTIAMVAPGSYLDLLTIDRAHDTYFDAQIVSVPFDLRQRITLDIVGDGLINVQVDRAALAAALASQSGDGRVALSSGSVDGLMDNVLNTEAVIRASSLVERDGSVYLEPAESSGQAARSGTSVWVAGPTPEGVTGAGPLPTIVSPTAYTAPPDPLPASASPVWNASVPTSLGTILLPGTTISATNPPASTSGSTTIVPGASGSTATTVTTAPISGAPIVSAPSPTNPTTGGTGGTTIVVADPAPVVTPPTVGPMPIVSPPSGGGSTGSHANNGFGNAGGDGVPGRSAKQDVTR